MDLLDSQMEILNSKGKQEKDFEAIVSDIKTEILNTNHENDHHKISNDGNDTSDSSLKTNEIHVSSSEGGKYHSYNMYRNYQANYQCLKELDYLWKSADVTKFITNGQPMYSSSKLELIILGEISSTWKLLHILWQTEALGQRLQHICNSSIAKEFDVYSDFPQDIRHQHKDDVKTTVNICNLKCGMLSEGQMLRMAFAEHKCLRVLIAISKWLKWKASKNCMINENDSIPLNEIPFANYKSLVKHRHKIATLLEFDERQSSYPCSILEMDFNHGEENSMMYEFFKKLWDFLRIGNIKAVDKLCRGCHQYWILGIIHGNEAFMEAYTNYDPNLYNIDSDLISCLDRCELSDQEWIAKACLWPSYHTIKNLQLDADDIKELGCTNTINLGKLGDGNRWRFLFKMLCQYVSATCNNRNLNIYERALYGYISGDLNSCLAVCKSVNDYIWCCCHCLKEWIAETILSSYREKQPNELCACEIKLTNSIVAKTTINDFFCTSDTSTLESKVFEYLNDILEGSEFYNQNNNICLNYIDKIRHNASDSFIHIRNLIILSQLKPEKYRDIYVTLHKWIDEGLIIDGKRISPVPMIVKKFIVDFSIIHQNMDLNESISSIAKPSEMDRDIFIGGFITDILKYGNTSILDSSLIDKIVYTSHSMKVKIVANFLWENFFFYRWFSDSGYQELQEYIWKLCLHFQSDMLNMITHMAEMAWIHAVEKENNNPLKAKNAQYSMEICERIQFVICCIVTMYKILIDGNSKCSPSIFLERIIIGAECEQSRLDNDFYSDKPSLRVSCVLTSDILAIIHTGLYCLSLITHLLLVGCLFEAKIKSAHTFGNNEQCRNHFLVPMKDFLEITILLDLYEPLLSKLGETLHDNAISLDCNMNDFTSIEIFLSSYQGDLLVCDTSIPLDSIHQFLGLKEYVKLTGTINSWIEAVDKHTDFGLFGVPYNEDRVELIRNSNNMFDCRVRMEKTLNSFFVEMKNGVFPLQLELSSCYDGKFLTDYYHLPVFCGGRGIPCINDGNTDTLDTIRNRLIQFRRELVWELVCNIAFSIQKFKEFCMLKHIINAIASSEWILRTLQHQLVTITICLFASIMSDQRMNENRFIKDF